MKKLVICTAVVVPFVVVGGMVGAAVTQWGSNELAVSAPTMDVHEMHLKTNASSLPEQKISDLF